METIFLLVILNTAHPFYSGMSSYYENTVHQTIEQVAIAVYTSKDSQPKSFFTTYSQTYKAYEINLNNGTMKKVQIPSIKFETDISK